MSPELVFEFCSGHNFYEVEPIVMQHWVIVSKVQNVKT